MTKLPHVMIALALAFGIIVSAAPRTASSAEIALSRCNSQTIDDANRRVGDYARQGTGGSQKQLLERFSSIGDVISTLGEERDVLNSVCSNETDRAALFAQIAATVAEALLVEADIAAHLNATPCPAAARALPAMMLADAWLGLANVVNEADGAVPTVFAGVIPKIQTRAQQVGLVLPPWGQTSQYWRDQIHAKSKAAVESCASPTPAPT